MTFGNGFGIKKLTFFGQAWKYIIILHVFCCSSAELMYTNEFAVHILGGEDAANKLAELYGFVNKGQIGSLKDYYLFEHHKIVKRSLEADARYHKQLKDNSKVKWIEQQHVKHRVKRGAYEKQYYDYPDPLYPDQWFLHGGSHGGYDMNVLPAWADGYTGKGVVVSILDDGIQTNHPDLAQNYDKLASLDINGQDDDPMPQDNGDNNHGTRCAGEVAAVAFNEFCGVGVAYNASIGGVRMLDGSVTDATEATALSHNPHHIHIYSASWGPEDNGKTVDGPGTLAKRAFSEGINKGRSGLGSIFVWASGNGGKYRDSCNCDGYTNSIYTISISSATQGGTMPWYLEQCSSTMATTFSSGTAPRDESITTVDMDCSYFQNLEHNRTPDPSSLCTKSHTGTSASAPIAAGICALALEANPYLTWRDMQYLVLMTSRPEPLQSEDGWLRNGVGRFVSSKFGYGLMDASAMVKLAKRWHTVPLQYVCETSPSFRESAIPSTIGEQLEVTMNTTGCHNAENAVIYLEHVQVKVTLFFKPRGNLKIILISPAGTSSTVLLPRPHDVRESSFNDWPFMSVHFWGEKVEGIWKLVIINAGSNKSYQAGKLLQWSLIFYGTKTWPIKLKEEKRTEHRSPQHTNPYDGYRETENFEENKLNECFKKNKFQIKIGEYIGCEDVCHEGYYADSRDYICHPCDKSCLTCFGPSYGNCLACPMNLYLSNNLCVKSCPDGYYADERKRECHPCSSSCATCEYHRDNCLSCQSSFFFFNHRCLPVCPSNTFVFKSTCKLCHTSCASCYSESALDCLECSPGYSLFNGSCIPTCPSNFYSDENHRCVRCHQRCRMCTNRNTCTACYSGMKLQGGTCVWHAYNNAGCEDGSSVNCQTCLENCALCSGPIEKDCLLCKDNFYWSGNNCIESCPEDSFTVDQECFRCPYMCEKCDPFRGICLSCKNNLVLHNGMCLSACPTGFYSDASYHCQPCRSVCLHCSGGSSNDCMSCRNNEFLFNKTCSSSCPEGYFAYEEISECVPCYHLCKSCTGFGPSSCTTCQKYSSFIHGLCVPCLDDEYFDENTQKCLRCHSMCGRCNGPSEYNCLACHAPLRLDETNYSCLQCCSSDVPSGKKCCQCKEELDICIGSGEPFRDTKLDAKVMYEFNIPMNNVVPIVVAICASAVVLFIILFVLLQAHSSNWYNLCFSGKNYERVPNPITARFDADMETVSLTQNEQDEEDDLYEKA